MGALIKRKQKDFTLKKMPKIIIEIAAESVKNNLIKRKGRFNPKADINIEDVIEVIYELSNFANDNLYFRDWSYEISYIPNFMTNSIFFEVLAKKDGLKTEIVLLSKLYESNTYMNYWKTAEEFIDELNTEIIELNKTIEKWNEIVESYKPYFYAKPPTDILYELFEVNLSPVLEKIMHENWGHYLEYGITNLPITAFDLFSVIDEITPIPFGDNDEWRLESEFTGDDDYVLLQIYIKHSKLNDIAFILEEAEGDFYESMPLDRAMDFMYLVLNNAKMAAAQWNNFLDNKGGYFNEKSTYFEDYK